MSAATRARVRRKLAIAGAAAAFVAFAPAEASAHLVTTGLGPFYDGVAHFVLSPGELVVVVALAALAAMQGTRSGRMVLALLPSILLVAGIAGQWCPTSIDPDRPTALAMVAVGALVAADRRLPPWAVATIVAVVGAVVGFVAGSALADGSSSALRLAGTVGAAFVAVTLVAGLVVSIRAFAGRIATRVAGSWVAAIGLLLLGWSVRAMG